MGGAPWKAGGRAATSRPAFTSIRPETHWRYEVTDKRQGPLWFSLRLSHDRAAELRDAFTEGSAEGVFRDLIAAGARMAPASHGALSITLETLPDMETVGTDLLVPREGFAQLRELAENRVVEITDAGLA